MGFKKNYVGNKIPIQQKIKPMYNKKRVECTTKDKLKAK